MVNTFCLHVTLAYFFLTFMSCTGPGAGHLCTPPPHLPTPKFVYDEKRIRYLLRNLSSSARITTIGVHIRWRENTPAHHLAGNPRTWGLDGSLVLTVNIRPTQEVVVLWSTLKLVVLKYLQNSNQHQHGYYLQARAPG